MDLEELKSLGCVPENLIVCKKYAATTESQLGNYSDEEKANVKAVILDNSIWVATPDRVAPSKADVVYSHDGKHFGFWNRQNFSFSHLELITDSLVAKSIINLLKEDDYMSGTKKAPEVNLDVGDVFAGDTQNAAEPSAVVELSMEEAFANASDDGPKKMDLGEPVTPKATKTEAEKAAEKEARERKAAEARAKYIREQNEIKSVAERSGLNAKVDAKFIENNFRYGRLLGFFVGTDPTVKISLVQTPINTGDKSHPKYTLRPGVTLNDDQKKKFKDGAVNIGSKYLECKTDIRFSQAAPSGIVAGVIKTPLLTELTSMSDLDGEKQFTAECAENHTMIVRVLQKEAMFPYLEFNYNKRIREDESIPNSTVISVKISPVNSTDAVRGTSVATKKFRSSFKADGRKVLVHGNYFPLSTYRTITLAAATREERELANNNFAALLKQHAAPPRKLSNNTMSAPKGPFSDEAQQKFNVLEQESNYAIGKYVCESALVNRGAVETCKPFDASAKDTMTMDIVKLPVRNATLNKDGTTTKYTYDKINFGDADSTTLTDTEYKGFIDRVLAACNPGTEFASIVKKALQDKKTVTRASRSTSRSAYDDMTGLQQLAVRMSPSAQVDSGVGRDALFAAIANAAV